MVGCTLDEATANAKKFAGDTEFTLERDNDMLDTWFSSGLWPWSIEGWPAKTSNFDKSYLSSILETG